MTRLVHTATCATCSWAMPGDMDEVERGAEKHTKTTGHATGTAHRVITDNGPDDLRIATAGRIARCRAAAAKFRVEAAAWDRRADDLEAMEVEA